MPNHSASIQVRLWEDGLCRSARRGGHSKFFFLKQLKYKGTPLAPAFPQAPSFPTVLPLALWGPNVGCLGSCCYHEISPLAPQIILSRVPSEKAESPALLHPDACPWSGLLAGCRA